MGRSEVVGGGKPQSPGKRSKSAAALTNDYLASRGIEPDISAFIRNVTSTPPRQARSGGPGPGAYSPQVDRKGGWGGRVYSFGGSKRSFVEQAKEESVSPGPAYNPTFTTTSTKCSPPRYGFGTQRKFPGRSKYGPGSTPGPGAYVSRVSRKGGGHLTDAPKFGFGTGSYHSPQDAFLKTPYMSAEVCATENLALHSPGPKYLPRTSLQETKVMYSLSAKGTLEFDSLRRSAYGPGPGAYALRTGLTRKGDMHIAGGNMGGSAGRFAYQQQR
mmetsp:Transcript_27995/g.91535  ORF Transcript_27995/g.91535 Transcript_27995/m.91535 type:complete len:272 (+) Transcript_27995:2-817(+)